MSKSHVSRSASPTHSAAPARSGDAGRRVGSGTPVDGADTELASTTRALDARTAELATARALTRATLESTADGILVTDERGRVSTFNEKFLQIWGCERGEVEGALHADIARLAAPRLRDAPSVARRIADIHAANDARMEGGETSDLIEMRDGRTLECISKAQRIDGRDAGRVWSYRDVTARLQAEDALRDEAGVLHFLNRTGATIAATLDIATLLQTVIDAATQVSGAAFGVFFYRDDRDFASAPDDVARAAPAPACTPRIAVAGIAQAAQGRFDSLRAAVLFDAAWGAGRTVRCADVTTEARFGTTATYFGVDGRDSPVRGFLAVPVTLRSGATVGGLFFGHPEVDVFTERTERIVVGVAAHAAIALDNARLVEGMRRVAAEREQLVEAERAARAESMLAAHIKDEFLSTLSHELRTPLTAILGWAKVLLLGRADEATQHRGLEAIARNADAQAALIEELLDMSRIVSGKVQLQLGKVDLAAVVDAAIAGQRGAAEGKRIVVERRVDPHACTVCGDAGRLQQAVENLLSNAIKFTPAGGRAQVAVVPARAAPGHVEIVVSDTGCGIDADFLPHVFDHFRQADSSITRRHGGLGLGLAIVRQLVALHGGAASARSDGPGRGATFTVRLPCGGGQACGPASGPEAEAAAADRADAYTRADLRGVRVLVVDDETDARELVAQLLVDRGADVRQAADAAAALREFDRAVPDVLLSDIGMPGRDGYQLIGDIRTRNAAQGGNVPAVAITAFARAEDRTRAMLAGFQAHLAKPIEPGDLVETVAALLPPRAPT